jgi:hypothetical protein
MTKENLLLELYKSIWEETREKEQITAQYLGIIVGAVGLVAIAIDRKSEYLPVAIFIAQIILIWGMLLALEAGYEYRRRQVLSSKIETEFNEETSGEINIFRIIPPFYLKVLTAPFNLPDIYWIHIITMGVIFVLLTLCSLIPKQDFWWDFLPTVGLVGSICFYWRLCKREKNHKETCEGKK